MEQGLFTKPQAIHTLEYLSPSKMSLLLKNPRAYFHKYAPGESLTEEKTKALKTGDFAHKCLLDRSAWDNLVVSPEFAGTGSRAAKQAWLASLPKDAMVIEEEEKLKVQRMCDSVLSDPEARALLEVIEGMNEVCAYARRDDGIWLHGRMDRVIQGPAVVEFKTTSGGVDWDEFVWDVFEYNYHMALAVYVEMIQLIYKKPCKESAWIIAQSCEPYSVRVHYPQDENMMDIGRFDMNRAIERYKSLIAKDPTMTNKQAWFSGKNEKEEGPCAFPYHIMIRRPEWQQFLTGVI